MQELQQTTNVFLGLKQALLRLGGIIIANELTTKTDFLTLTFGLTDGWWLYDDPQWRMPGVHLMFYSRLTRTIRQCLTS